MDVCCRNVLVSVHPSGAKGSKNSSIKSLKKQEPNLRGSANATVSDPLVSSKYVNLGGQFPLPSSSAETYLCPQEHDIVLETTLPVIPM
mmetsp:Transcript_7968/g.8845  ORF Transcript_7968/g.8845 Transcript_7968/m.8845 type:complete len:89 (-) Transcript_7968:385-651(-)